jgi:predicted GIY-YIG superfamily endonuclease
MAEKTNIYILRLEGGKYYVGKSSNVTERYMQHLSGKGSAWTKKYKPVQLLKTITNVSHFEEDRYVKEYMSKFGIDNVRGGAYVIDKLNEQDIDTLNKEIRAATDKCTNCGKAGHWVKDCYAKKNNTRNKIEYDEDLDEKPVKKNKNNINNKIEYDEDLHKKPLNKKVKSVKQTDTCYRCGRTGHYSPDCYARSHREGYDLSDNDDDEDDEDDEDDDDDDDDDY